ncbi:hypothetical protein DEIPH_ctg079orf0096 [Deinococcus phoenicis]|uniref:Uncharacterized protein n=1 Tax=Deinococcus phoenicis TaxID=1476583 RepID=A0A016QKW6_9DEIO|nr:hypothetical protein DEIPH_ctg079orf0096 [Deinococcus phoenicis]
MQVLPLAFHCLVGRWVLLLETPEDLLGAVSGPECQGAVVLRWP